MFKVPTVDSIVKQFTTILSDLEKVMSYNNDAIRKLTEEKTAIENRIVFNQDELERANRIKSNISKLID